MLDVFFRSESAEVSNSRQLVRSQGGKVYRVLFIASLILFVTGCALLWWGWKPKSQPALAASSAFHYPPPPVRFNLEYARYVELAPRLRESDLENLRQVSEFGTSSEIKSLNTIVNACREMQLTRRTTINDLMHAMMAFGKTHPVTIAEGKSIPVLSFMQHYYEYLSPTIRASAPNWISLLHGEYTVRTAMWSGVIADHLGQLSYCCAIAGVPADAKFTLKDGARVALESLVSTDLRHADPALFDPTWETVECLQYWPQKPWRNLSGRAITPIDFARADVNFVIGQPACAHSHPLISAAYWLSATHGKKHSMVPLRDGIKASLSAWRHKLRTSLCADGAVSSLWYFGKSVHPLSEQEILIANGHHLEWLSLYLSPQELRSKWITRLIGRLCLSIRRLSSDAHAGQPLPFSYPAFCHAARAIRLFQKKCGISRAASMD